jgi:hypothetical protein
MGQPSSPLASGYVLIDPTTAYEASVGHGWTSSPELAYLRPPPDWKVPHNLPEALIRDGVQSVGDITFRVDLPKGTYHVKAVLGDLGSTSGMLLKTPRERMDVFAGGIPVVTDAFARTMTDKGSLDYSIGGYKQVRFLSEVTGGGARDPVSL